MPGFGEGMLSNELSRIIGKVLTKMMKHMIWYIVMIQITTNFGLISAEEIPAPCCPCLLHYSLYDDLYDLVVCCTTSVAGCTVLPMGCMACDCPPMA